MIQGKRTFRRISRWCAAITILLGLVTLAGWVSGLPLLASVRATYIPMAPSTAFCFTMLGGALIIHQSFPAWRWSSRVPALLAMMIAVAKLIEIAAGYRFGIDAWFVRNPGMFGAVPTGRMAPLTALNFMFAAIGTVALSGVLLRRLAGSCGALATIVSLVVLIGYSYGTPLLYGGTIIPVAFSTACGFFFCGIAVVASAGRGAWPLRTFVGDSTRASLLRAFVPLTVAAAVVNGWITTSLLRRTHANPALIAALCAVAFAFLITWIISQVSRAVGGRIDRAEAERNRAQTELVALNAHLETRVQERTRELREKNEQMREELKMARELQIALLPQNFPTVPANVSAHESALRFLSLYFPTGDVSGDFFSVFPVGDEAAGVLICDVMGHGVRSALITSMIRGLVEEHAQASSDPGKLLTRINNALSLILKQADTTMFATCFYLVADVRNSEIRFANAGHPSALHLTSADRGVSRLRGDGSSGPAMGMFPAATYTTAKRSMAKGDLIVLFTDGLFEVEDSAGNLFSQDELEATALKHAALPPQEFFGRVLGDIRQFSQRESFEDDVCVVGVQVQHTNGAGPVVR